MKFMFTFATSLLLLGIFSGCRQPQVTQETPSTQYQEVKGPNPPIVVINPVPPPAQPKSTDSGMVYGLGSGFLFAEPEMKMGSKAISIQEGEMVWIDRRTENGKALVHTNFGKKGWLFTGSLCSPAEEQRREKAHNMPMDIMPIAYENGQFVFVYGPFGKVVKPTWQPFPLMVIWMTESTRGKTLKLGDFTLEGDPSVLYKYQGETLGFQKLPIDIPL